MLQTMTGYTKRKRSCVNTVKTKTLKQICDLCMLRTWRQRHLSRFAMPLRLHRIGHRRVTSASRMWRCAIGLSYPWHWRTSLSMFYQRRKWASSAGLAQVCMPLKVRSVRSFEMLNCNKQIVLKSFLHLFKWLHLSPCYIYLVEVRYLLLISVLHQILVLYFLISLDVNT